MSSEVFRPEKYAPCDLRQLLEPKSYQKKCNVIYFTILVYGDRKGTKVTFSGRLASEMITIFHPVVS